MSGDAGFFCFLTGFGTKIRPPDCTCVFLGTNKFFLIDTEWRFAALFYEDEGQTSDFGRLGTISILTGLLFWVFEDEEKGED